jgi:hypothetical protein
MSTRAVTPGAPAASDRINEALESGFLPDDPNYMLTGKFGEPAKKADDEEQPEIPAVKEGASAASEEDAEIAAASAAASTQGKERKGPATTKTKAHSESRQAQLSRENKELKETLARMQAQQPAATRETKQASEPAAAAKGKPEPQIDDVDPKTGKPLYANWAEHQKALRAWDREEATRSAEERFEGKQRERNLAEAERTIERVVNTRVEAARKAHADYDDTLHAAMSAKNEHGQEAIFYTKGSPIDLFLLESDRGSEIVYQVAKNLDQYKHIFARNAQGQYLMPAIRQLRELAKIEHSLEAAAGTARSQTTTTPAKTVSQAHRPPNQTTGTGAVGREPIAEALEEGDFDQYRREANARDPRLKALLRG